MVDITGSDNLGGVNQTGDNDFTGDKFWYEWTEFTNSPNNLTSAGFNTADGTVAPGTTIYNAGGTDDLDGLVSNGSAQTLGNDVVGDATLFGVRVTTTLTVTKDGNYRFDVRSDDGVILYVDGVQVVVDDSLHGPRTRSGDIDLTEGEHEIVIIYFERTGQNVLEVDIQSDAGGDYPTEVRLQDANVLANQGDDTVNAGEGDDTVDGGAGNDTIDGGDGDDTLDGEDGNDTLTGGDGDDVFIVSGGTDIITDFGAGESGSIDDGDQTNNDFVDLSGFYNATTLAAVNGADADPSNDFGSALGMLRADAADGTIDGIINGVDYSGQIGDIDLSLLFGGAPVTGGDLTFDNTNVPCFAAGAIIMTDQGPRPIDDLSEGCMVQTKDRGFQPIRWIGSRTFDAVDLAHFPRLKPIKIAAGTLGHGIPSADLRVSRQHRVLVSSLIAERMFGTPDVLIAAIKLTALDGIDVIEDATDVTYYHMLFDNHEVIYSNGAPTESLLTAPQALGSMTQAALDEIFAIFPQLRDDDYLPDAACFIPAPKRQRRLIERHLKNDRPLQIAV